MNQAGPAAQVLDGPGRERADGGGHRGLRDVLGRFATGVTVITTSWHGTPVGLTVNSFTPVSLDPPLVLWCLNRNSSTRPAFTEAGYFAVNILAARQRDLAARFAARTDRFCGVPVHLDRHGLPVLDQTAGTIICRRDRILDGGDHHVLIGTILEYLARPEVPLVFLDGGFHRAPGPDSKLPASGAEAGSRAQPDPGQMLRMARIDSRSDEVVARTAEGS